jgi:hypothetical protein
MSLISAALLQEQKMQSANTIDTLEAAVAMFWRTNMLTDQHYAANLINQLCASMSITPNKAFQMFLCNA